MSGIIDSVLRNFYVPPVIFSALPSPSLPRAYIDFPCFVASDVSYSDDGSELRTCIDGKQRLTSLVRCAYTPSGLGILY